MRMFSRSALAACSLMALLGKRPVSAETTKTYRIAGLTAPAEIIIDRWGVPHIYAQTTTTPSSCRATTPRATGSGRSTCGASAGSALGRQLRPGLCGAGPRRPALPLPRRHGPRVGWPTAPTRETRRGLHRRRQRLCGRGERRQAAAAGGVQADRQPAGDLGTRGRPAHPQPRPVPNVTSEVARAAGRLRRRASTADRLRASWSRRTPGSPDGLDPCVVPPDVLEDYVLATAPVNFDAPKDGRRPARARARTRCRHWAGDRADQREGSNNWVIAAVAHRHRPRRSWPTIRTAPHGAPSLRYIAHLNAPGLDSSAPASRRCPASPSATTARSPSA